MRWAPTMRTSGVSTRSIRSLLAALVVAPVLIASQEARAHETSAPAPESPPPRAWMEHEDPAEDLTMAGEVGRGLTICGGILTATGALTMLVGAVPSDRSNADDAKLYGGAGMAVTGVVLIGVGVPLWATGEKDEERAMLRVGLGSVELSGRF
jgi:hypothetical protein